MTQRAGSPGDEGAKKFFYIRSETYSMADDPYKRIEIIIEYSEKDWSSVCREAEILGYIPEKFLEERFKRASRPKTSIVRVEKSGDRKKLYDGYTDFWLPYINYLIYAHFSVIVGNLIADFIFHSMGKFEVFYWFYMISLVLAIVSWLGFRFMWLLGRDVSQRDNKQELYFQLLLAKYAELLMWSSVTVFGLSLSLRIIIGVTAAVSRL